jgi:hypothetical protein
MQPEPAHLQGFVGVVIRVMPEPCNQDIAREILLGLEEEQVPYQVQPAEYESGDALATAHQASRKSIFRVGICIAPDAVVLHCSRLSKDNPLFIIPVKAGDPKTYRILGQNAAKFIKGRPFDKI